MKTVASLRQQLIIALAVLLVASLAAATLAVWIAQPFTGASGATALFLGILVALDVVVFLVLGYSVLRRVVLEPLRSIADGAETIASGEYSRRIETRGAEEFERVASSVEEIAEKLILNQKTLAENVRSLNEVNRELTEARDELIRAEKLASVGQLAAGIAHEVGNPLGAVLGYLEVAERRPQIGRELINDMRREARRIDRIVKGLLDYARPRQPAPRPIEVNEVVQSALELLRAQGRFNELHLVLNLSDDLPAVRADSHQLEQSLVNLLLNASQASNGREGHRIVLTTELLRYEFSRPSSRRRDDPPGIDYSHLRRLQARRAGLKQPPFAAGSNLVRISVFDNGPGIPREIRDRVFDPFFSTKEAGQGTGLGLAVSARLIEGMGGTVEVDSPEDGGVCFSIYLPAANQGRSH